jgi:hypothetical protein
MDGPRVLTVHGADYAAAFDTAMEVAKAHGLRPVVADRETGVIETDARAAGSILEPWRVDNSGLVQALSNTVNFERVEFVPAGMSLAPPDPEAPVAPAALPGSDRAEARVELSAFTGPIEIRAWVFVEREFRPYQQVGTWTQRQTRYADDPTDRPAKGDDTVSLPGTWTPVGRDEAYERTLMAEIQRRLANPGAAGRAG